MSETNFMRDESRDYWDGSAYDPETVRFFDVAHEGAQARALIPAVATLSERLGDSRPRAVVIIPTDSVARACAHFVSAEQSAVPVMIAPDLPSFVGALDIVVVVGERAQHDVASRALIAAEHRGAHTVLIAPGAGPLLDDAPSDTIVLPALPTAEGPSPTRFIAGLHAVFAALGQPASITENYLEGIASELDAELEQLSPERGAEVNPARQLRDFVEGAHVIHTGPLADVIGAVWAVGGLGGTVVPPEALPIVLERRHSAAQHAGLPDRDDPFFDPFLDGPPLVLSKVILWGNDVPDADTALPNTLAVPAASAHAHPLQLIVRAYAATALDPSKGE